MKQTRVQSSGAFSGPEDFLFYKEIVIEIFLL